MASRTSEGSGARLLSEFEVKDYIWIPLTIAVGFIAFGLLHYRELHGFYPWRTKNVLCVEGPDGSNCALVEGESGDVVSINEVPHRDKLPPDSLGEISVTYEGRPIRAHYIQGARPGADIAVTLP